MFQPYVVHASCWVSARRFCPLRKNRTTFHARHRDTDGPFDVSLVQEDPVDMKQPYATSLPVRMDDAA